MKKIAFIHTRKRHWAVKILIKSLENAFPEYQIETINVTDLIRANINIRLLNRIHIIGEYGRDILAGEKRFHDCFMRTPFIFRQIKKLLRKRLAGGEYAFTFQDQSLYDGCIRHVPHFVLTDHTHLANRYYPGFRKKRDLYSAAWIRLEKCIYENADLVFVKSENIRESVIRDYAIAPDRVKNIRYAIDTLMAGRPADPGRYKNRNILFVGRDWNRKGGPVLIRAFQKVLKTHPDARLTIIGCSPDISAPNTEIIGKTERGRVDSYYRKASVFCLPTRKEPLGLSFIEAMSHGLPIIGTKIGAIPELVKEGHNGFLTDTDDAEQLAQILTDLLGRPEQCEFMGNAAYDFYAEKYTFENFSNLLRQHILDTSGSGSR
ncbi:glycosyl transferase family 1 [Desulfonema ishimotonii]|uniref:Glycosyl transferase family 1 n=1 Tax=Desulfonema ishimotonii TaxID=45657 RepID=A0A401FVE7_9BACT|nr:glycosyltransferase family 4 protein [Desulfonema ishimotonii]GBC60928.1 glycosyl transferase family 1 [Desulfonema ishimotonii]